MFDKKLLTEENLQSIQSWVDAGARLPDIQENMESELGHRLTYMETRFLVLDLGLELKTEEPEQDDDDEQSGDEAAELTEDDIEVIPPSGEGGAVSVTVDEIARPGVMVSGRVTFPDGEGGMWYVDEMGRLGIDPDTAGYRPSEADVLAFQKRLQEVMENR